MTKVVPPALPPGHVARPALESWLDSASARRLTVVQGGPGWGKSTLLAGWAAGVRAAWLTLDRTDRDLDAVVRGVVDALRVHLPKLPADLTSALEGGHGPDGEAAARADAFVAAVCEALHDELRSSLVLVLDDLHEVSPATAAARFVEGLCRQGPAALHMVVSSREDPPFPVGRLRGQGHASELDPARLAFSDEEVAELLSRLVGSDAVALARQLRSLTDGWPAAVHLAIEALRPVASERRQAALDAFHRPGGALLSYLAEEVFEHEPVEVRELVRLVAPLGRVSVSLCAALGIDDAEALLPRLARRGIVSEVESVDGSWALSRPVRDYALAHLPLQPDEHARVNRAAAAWYAALGRHTDSLRCLVAVPDLDGVAALLNEHGETLVAAGEIPAVEAAAELLPEHSRGPRIESLLGEARQVRGDWAGALACYRRAGGSTDGLAPALAWRMGLIAQMRGEFEEALSIFGRAVLGNEDTRDEAMLMSYVATAQWLKGDFEDCRAWAARANAAADRCGDAGATAAAHTILAMMAAVDGDRRANDAFYVSALNAAERAGDVLQIARIRSNRGSRLTEEGQPADAVDELDIAIRYAELCGFTARAALAYHNRGEAKLMLGRLEEAIGDYAVSRRLYQGMGSRMVAYPLTGLGRVHRERGEVALARSAYEEALAVAEPAHDVQARAAALAGLARVRVADDPAAALALAERAVAIGPTVELIQPLLALGWVALRVGDPLRAAKVADEAAAAARARRDPAGLAESLELSAFTGADAAAARTALDEAAALWRGIGNPIGEARAELVAARLAGAAGRPLADRAQARLQHLGVREQVQLLAGPIGELPRHGPAVRIATLGTFRVLRDGEPVPTAEWQSKKARDLLKILVARRGRPVPREQLMELLWPGDDPAKLANRFSVALSTVRGVLDPDRRVAGEGAVVADRSVVWLDLDAVQVDVEEFLATAKGALERFRVDPEAALVDLAAADGSYGGDFLEEDPYEEWAVPLREECRATYVAVVRGLAAAAMDTGDADMAVRYCLRLLEQDRYDEETHLGLVRTLLGAGRHGEAHRRYRHYVAQMAEIGVEPAALPTPFTRR